MKKQNFLKAENATKIVGAGTEFWLGFALRSAMLGRIS